MSNLQHNLVEQLALSYSRARFPLLLPPWQTRVYGAYYNNFSILILVIPLLSSQGSRKGIKCKNFLFFSRKSASWDRQSARPVAAAKHGCSWAHALHQCRHPRGAENGKYHPPECAQGSKQCYHPGWIPPAQGNEGLQLQILKLIALNGRNLNLKSDRFWS